ncbi:MAG: tRNA (cytidine(34)-2'-O)-methyltransferase [Gammaproteobacteria bacterium]|nr:tRNA (cytidine(34)-2'-O)-methyltransferase [Gammaproteobacteria bacterium]
MFDVVLYQPEIPPNTGNIIRLCANVGARLHLVHPYGFFLDDSTIRRAAMDYRESVKIHEHIDLGACQKALSNRRWLAYTTKGEAYYNDIAYQENDVLLFGPETRGLPASLLDVWPAEHKCRIPMQAGSRSLNLSNSVAVVVYEAWRQHDFA